MQARVDFEKIAPERSESQVVTLESLRAVVRAGAVPAGAGHDAAPRQLNGCAYCIDTHTRMPGPGARPSNG